MRKSISQVYLHIQTVTGHRSNNMQKKNIRRNIVACDKATIRVWLAVLILTPLPSYLIAVVLFLHRIPFIMTTSIWLLIVKDNFERVEGRFEVEMSSEEKVSDLKTKAKAAQPDTFSRHDLNPDSLTVWKTEGELIINKTTSTKDLEEILKMIDAKDPRTIRRLDEVENLKVGDLQLPRRQVLLLRLPGMSRIFTTAGCLILFHLIC
jgi:hypothetical protein